MLELGQREEEFHAEIGDYLSPDNTDLVFTFGPLSLHTARKAKDRFPEGAVLPFTDKEKLIEALLERVTEKDIVLVKASRGMRLEHVVDALKALPGGNNGVRGELMDFQLLLLTIGVAFVLAVISAPPLIPLAAADEVRPAG